MASRVLYITPNYLNMFGGGALGQQKINKALIDLLCINRIEDFKVLSPDEFVDNEADIIIKKNKLFDILSRVFFHSNYMYFYQKKILNYIKKNNFDTLILGNSRLGFLAKKMKKKFKNIKVITHFDNVEYDYVISKYKLSKFKPLCTLEKIITYKDEKKAVINSDLLLFLSIRDMNRISEIYGAKNLYFIYPVCIEQKIELPPFDRKNQNIVFIGSLNYSSNLVAIKNLISVFERQTIFKKLIIAGSNPNDKFYELINGKRYIETHINFDKISDFLRKGDILISLIDVGAGMKVKVAEAMSLGLLVCGTKETFVGYENCLSNENGLFLVDNETDVLDVLKKISSYTDEKLEHLANNNIKAYEKYFSMERSKQIMIDILK